MPDEITGPTRTEEPGSQICVHSVEKCLGCHDLIYCLHPGCYAQGFRQGIELEDHYKLAHKTTPSQDFVDAPSAPDPFDRLESFLESLRKSADVERSVDQESSKNTDSLQKPSRRSRQVGWKWRCAKCSQIVDLDCYGYACPFCRQT